ncbi:phage tail protein [Salmonella enterica]|nr:phage tail protein [Salmonella enterica]EGZ5736526.1 phage tail protein [Salmonella enterica]
MSVLISGALVDGAGIPLSGCHIILKSRVNTSEVVMRTIADVVTGNNGEYSFEAQAGKYCVYLKQDWRDEYCVGDISVYHDAKPGTLNDFLTALSEDDLKPDVVRRFEEMVAQAQQSAEAAALSEQNAKNHADNAAGSAQQTAQDVTATTTARQDAERFAGAAKQNAVATAVDRKATAENVKQSKANAASSAQSAQDAVGSARAAAQAKNEIDVTLAGTLKAANHLSEIAAAGEGAQQESRDNLGLKNAAIYDVQKSIYDRTEGCLAMPGAFGYGAFFRTIKMFSADKGPSEFLPWVKSNPPGQYAVSQYGGNGYKPILEGVVFDGIVEIKIPGMVVSNESHHIKDKLVIFYGCNGEVYHNRLIVNSISGDRFRGWRNWLLGADGIANTLSSLRGSGYGYPDIGGVVLAAYCGTSDTDSSRKFYRGVRVPGSRLAVISVTAACNTGGPYASTPQVIVASPGLCPMAGTFTALSGSPGTSGGTTSAMIGLFVRTA